MKCRCGGTFRVIYQDYREDGVDFEYECDKCFKVVN